MNRGKFIDVALLAAAILGILITGMRLTKNIQLRTPSDKSMWE
jgi:hypothetical protein